MNVFSLRPRVAELVLQVYGRPLHPELFDILASRHIQRESYDLSVRITRTGHVISWRRGDLFLTEVTDAGLSLSQVRRLFSQPMRGEHSGRLNLGCGFIYQMNFQVETLTPEIFLHVHDEILADGSKRGLLHNFRPNHRLAVSPLGHISAEARPGCLFLSTFHTFPEENTVVKTQSMIEQKIV
ncbi:MAG: DUF2617 family protein [Planctomycetes bacterium]|nr:DUF2617 family protein [Planctomycetota bacterium]